MSHMEALHAFCLLSVRLRAAKQHDDSQNARPCQQQLISQTLPHEWLRKDCMDVWFKSLCTRSFALHSVNVGRLAKRSR
jgi:hypothetical protein